MQGEQPTCLESLKIPGRYHVNMKPCISTIMHGVEMVSLFGGGCRLCSDFSFFFAALVSDFKGVFGTLSA
jgi:hypothetical protein